MKPARTNKARDARVEELSTPLDTSLIKEGHLMQVLRTTYKKAAEYGLPAMLDRLKFLWNANHHDRFTIVFKPTGRNKGHYVLYHDQFPVFSTQDTSCLPGPWFRDIVKLHADAVERNADKLAEFHRNQHPKLRQDILRYYDSQDPKWETDEPYAE